MVNGTKYGLQWDVFLLIAEIETTGHAAGTVGVMTKGFVGVGGVRVDSVLVHAKQNIKHKTKNILFVIYF